MTLEDVALDAVVEDGRLVARTSARQVAEHLRVDPLAVARALKVLRNRGLVSLEPDRAGIGRRFGLWVYVLGPVSGLTVVDERCTPSWSPSLRPPGQEGFWWRARVVVSAAFGVPPGGWQVSVPVRLLGMSGSVVEVGVAVVGVGVGGGAVGNGHGFGGGGGC